MSLAGASSTLIYILIIVIIIVIIFALLRFLFGVLFVGPLGLNLESPASSVPYHGLEAWLTDKTPISFFTLR